MQVELSLRLKLAKLSADRVSDRQWVPDSIGAATVMAREATEVRRKCESLKLRQQKT